MPRAEVGTPKWLANKMKAKGLQRLRWYCQMCEKQCRDENGFKCHRMSEGHQRQMQVFMQRANRYIDDFSRQFEATFMQLMRTRYCRTRVLANTVYCELIGDKQHIHMNSTRWATLSEFVLYLKRTNKCTVEHTEQGWYLEYIDKEKLDREARELANRKIEISSEQRRQRILAKKIQEAWKNKKQEDFETTQHGNEENLQESLQTPISLKISASQNAVVSKKNTPNVASYIFDESNDGDGIHFKPHESNKKKQTNLDRIIVEQEKKKGLAKKANDKPLKTSALKECFQKKSHTDLEENVDSDEAWLYENIIVRIMSIKFANGQYYKEKGLVIGIKDKFVGVIKILCTEDIIMLDQEFLEPVIPGLNGKVRVIRGPLKGSIGIVKTICVETETAEIQVCNSNNNHSSLGTDSSSLQSCSLYNICKIFVQS